MDAIPRYLSPVSIIPGGCPQFLDFALPEDELKRIRRYFREEKKQEATPKAATPTICAAWWRRKTALWTSLLVRTATMIMSWTPAASSLCGKTSGCRALSAYPGSTLARRRPPL